MTDASQFDPIPAVGFGAERFDQPALFYLTHQSTIEQWHALRTTVAAALKEWFATTVRDALVSVADQRGWDLSSAAGPPGYDHLLLHPPTTPILKHRPIVGVGFGWSKGVNPKSNPPFACVRCSRTEPGRRAAEVLLAAGGRDFRKAQKLKGSDSEAWPIWWTIPAAERWWTDLDGYRDRIVSEVQRGLDGVGEAMVVAASIPVEGSIGEEEEPEESLQESLQDGGEPDRDV